MINTIEVIARSAYGRVHLYPSNEAAHLLARLCNAKTLTTAQLQTAREMGYTISVRGDDRHALQIQESLK